MTVPPEAVNDSPTSVTPHQRDSTEESDVIPHNIPYSVWIEMFEQHPITATKDITGFANKAKKEARIAICSKLKELYPEKELTEEQVRKSLNNKKSLLLKKVDGNVTGNIQTILSDGEKKLLRILNGPDCSNPAIVKMPGAAGSFAAPATAMSPGLRGKKRVIKSECEIKVQSPSPKRARLTEDMSLNQLQYTLFSEQITFYQNQNRNFELMSDVHAKLTQLTWFVEQLQDEVNHLKEICGLTYNTSSFLSDINGAHSSTS